MSASTSRWSGTPTRSIRPDIGCDPISRQRVAGFAKHPVAEWAEADERQFAKIVERHMVDRAQVARPDMVAQTAIGAFEQHAVIDAEFQTLGGSQRDQVARLPPPTRTSAFRGRHSPPRPAPASPGDDGDRAASSTCTDIDLLPRPASSRAELKAGTPQSAPNRSASDSFDVAYGNKLDAIRILNAASMEFGNIARANDRRADGVAGCDFT